MYTLYKFDALAADIETIHRCTPPNAVFKLMSMSFPDLDNAPLTQRRSVFECYTSSTILA